MVERVVWGPAGLGCKGQIAAGGLASAPFLVSSVNMTLEKMQVSIFSLCLALTASAAFACSPPSRDYKVPLLANQVKQHLKQADAIVDGEIIRVGGYDQKNKKEIPALLKVKRIFKGPNVQTFFLRIPGGGCEIGFRRKEKVRLLLSESGGSWAALENLNRPYPIFGGSIDSHSIDNRVLYARLLDKRIGSPRSLDTAIMPDGL